MATIRVLNISIQRGVLLLTLVFKFALSNASAHTVILIPAIALFDNWVSVIYLYGLCKPDLNIWSCRFNLGSNLKVAPSNGMAVFVALFYFSACFNCKKGNQKWYTSNRAYSWWQQYQHPHNFQPFTQVTSWLSLVYYLIYHESFFLNISLLLLLDVYYVTKELFAYHCGKDFSYSWLSYTQTSYTNKNGGYHI